MAVEILARDFHVHVRRVMLRSGLGQRDDPDHMIAAAGALHEPA